MDRKRKRSIFYSKRHKQRLTAKQTETDIEMIRNQTEHSIAKINNNELNVDKHKVEHTDRNTQSDSEDNTDVNFPNKNNMTHNYGNTTCNETTIDNNSSFKYEDLFLNDKENMFIQDISTWAIEHNISHRSLHKLLHILQKYTNYALPKNPRTLLHTPQTTQIIQIAGGDYCHFGTEKALLKIIEERKRLKFTLDTVQLLINIDGLISTH